MVAHRRALSRAAGRLARGVGIGLVGLLASLTSSCVLVRAPDTIAHSTGTHMSPSLSEVPSRFLKRKVVLARFSNETLRGKSVLLSDTPDLIPRQAAEILSTRLTRSGKVLLFEGPESGTVVAALEEGRLSELGLPADFLIIGSITEFSRETISKRGILGSRTKRQKARARVNLRLVDVHSSRVIFSEEAIGEAESEVGEVLGIGTKTGRDASIDGKAISAAISKLVSNLMENLLDQPWRSAILSIRGDRVLIAGSRSEGLLEGDTLAVLLRGETVINPRTNSPVELPGRRVATIEVESFVGDAPETAVARCRVVAGDLPEEDPAAYTVEEEAE